MIVVINTYIGETSLYETVEGQDVLLKCPENVQNSSVIWWNYDQQRIVVNGKVLSEFNQYISYDRTSGNLTIQKVLRRDSGVYYCTVGFREPHAILLIVSGKFQHNAYT